MIDFKERIKRRHVEFDASPYSDFIKKMNLGEFSLSPSSIREFAISPICFLRYKTGLKEETESMKMGTLAHTLIFEPQTFFDKYVILEKAEGFEDATWAKKENKEIKEQTTLLAEEKGLEVVTEGDLSKLLDAKDAVLSNSMASELIHGCHSYEVSKSFKYGGYDWNCRIDGLGYNYILDLKRVADARPEKLKWKLKERGFAWQGFLNMKAAKMNPAIHHFYNVCVDGSLNVSVIRQDYFDMSVAEAQINEKLKDLTRCIIGENWNHNLEFYAKQGYYLSSEIS